MHPFTTWSHDVAVVGARSGGAATALALARQGHRVALIDRATFPSDTLSTHAIARGGVVLLDRWGLLDAVMASGAPAIRQVTFRAAGAEATRTVKDRAGVDHLVAPRRHVLDRIVVDSAVAAGVDLFTATTVTGVERDPGGRVVGVRGRDADGRTHRFGAQVVVGADGRRSRIADAVDAPVVDRRAPGGGTAYAYFTGDAWPGFEFHLADRLMAGVFPTHHGEACIWVCGPAERLAGLSGRGRAAAFLDLVAAASPVLARQLGSARRVSPVRSAAGLPNHRRRPWGPGWALVGDAGMHRDPVTGHGITDAFRDAELAARAIGETLRGERLERDAMSWFHRTRDELSADVFEATVAMSQYPALDRFVALQKQVSRAIEAEALALADLVSPAALPLVA